MSTTARALDFQNIGTAWRFVLDCEDENPRAYGVDSLPLLPMRRDGVHRQRVCGEAAQDWPDVWGYEDALIARLEGGAAEEDDEDDEDPADDGCVVAAGAVDDEEEPDADEPAWMAALSGSVDADDPAEALPQREGLGHRLQHRAAVLLRFPV